MPKGRKGRAKWWMMAMMPQGVTLVQGCHSGWGMDGSRSKEGKVRGFVCGGWVSRLGCGMLRASRGRGTSEETRKGMTGQGCA